MNAISMTSARATCATTNAFCERYWCLPALAHRPPPRRALARFDSRPPTTPAIGMISRGK